MVKWQQLTDGAILLDFKRLCMMMDDNDEEELAPNLQSNMDGIISKWSSRNKRQVKKKITLLYLLKVICATRETCLEWLKYKNFIPRIMFCPKCTKKMFFEENEDAIDGYVWSCKECTDNPPRYSSRHASWLENKNASLATILLFTYLWSHSFTEQQICQETNLSSSIVQEWSLIFSTICDSVYQKSIAEDDNSRHGSPPADLDTVTFWRTKNKQKDLFLQFLKDADSL